MTRIELRDMLLDRVGWKQPTTSDFTISEENKTSEGGRYFQEEHAFVKISTIYALMEEVKADSDGLNEYLKELRKIVVLTVIDEVFADFDLNPIDFEGQESMFDAAISKRMAMKIFEILVATNRENITKRISKDAMRAFFLDVNGGTEKTGIAKLYNRELTRLRDFFNTEEGMLDVSTMSTNIFDGTEEFLWP